MLMDVLSTFGELSEDVSFFQQNQKPSNYSRFTKNFFFNSVFAKPEIMTGLFVKYCSRVPMCK